MILLFAAMLVMQANWVPAGSVAQGSYAYDASSLSRSGGNVRVQMRIALSATEPTGLRSMVMGVSFDCAGRTMTTHRVIGYDESGAMIGDHVLAPAEVVTVALASNMIEDGIRQRLCG